MVALLLQPPLLFLCNVPLLFDDVVIGFITICYVHLYECIFYMNRHYLIALENLIQYFQCHIVIFSLNKNKVISKFIPLLKLG